MTAQLTWEEVMGSPTTGVSDKKVKLIFADCLIKKPLIYEMTQIYEIITNIAQANVNETEGWAVLEINGAESEIDKALIWLTEQGVVVQTMFPTC